MIEIIYKVCDLLIVGILIIGLSAVILYPLYALVSEVIKEVTR